MINKWNPSEDGVTHINIYSKAKTRLGFLMSNFARMPIEIPKDGFFTSMEGYWYWLRIAPSLDREQLRLLYGFEAKKKGRELGGKDRYFDAEFENKIKTALEIKVNTHIELQERLQYCPNLPFTHYYVFNNKVIEPKEGKWIIDWWEEKRKELQNS